MSSIDWQIVNKSYPQAVAFAYDDVGQAYLFGEVPRYVANRWGVGHGVWKAALGLLNPVPSNPAGSLQIRADKAPAGWVEEGPTPPPQLKPGERAPQVEPIHAKGWATSGPAPQGMTLITDAQASGAQMTVQSSVIPGISMNPHVKPPTVSVVHPQVEAKQPVPATNLILTKVLIDLVEGLPAGKRKDQLLELLVPPV